MEPYLLSLADMPLLFAIGFFAGFVDSIAGGGGLISLPALLALGIPPQAALGTNKLQGSFGTLSATWNYIRKKKVSLRKSVTGIVFTFLGAAMGAFAIQHMKGDNLKHLIPFLLIGVFFYTLFTKNLDREDRKALMPETPFFILFGLCLGFYDGFFGPGTGSFWTAAFMLVLGYGMTQASGYTRVMNFVSNVVALGLFIAGGNVIFSVGLTMAMGQVIGARAGSGLAIKNGAAFIRPVFMTVVFLTILRLFYTNYAHLL